MQNKSEEWAESFSFCIFEVEKLLLKYANWLILNN